MSTAADGPTLEYKWTDYQAHVRDLLESQEYDLVVLRTGYGGGKSITGCQWVHRGSIQLDHGESLVMGQDFKKAKSTTFRVFFDTLPGQNTIPNDAGGDPENSPIVAGYNHNESRLTYTSGHVVRLGSADLWSRYAGSEFHRIYCDEVGHYPDAVNTDLYQLHEMLSSRQRTAAGPNTMLWTSTGNGFNQYYDITERQVGPDDEPLPWADRMQVVVASTEHNTLLPPDALEKQKRTFEGSGREEQALHGGFAAAEGRVYDDFSRRTHVRSAATIEGLLPESQNRHTIYGYDHGWSDPRVLVRLDRTHADQWAATDLFYRSESKFAELLDADAGTGWLADNPRGTIYSEHRPEHIAAFEAAGFPAMKANKDLDGGIDHVRDRLAVEDGLPGLLVADGCIELIQELLSYQEQHVGTAQADDHAADALRYALFTHANPTDTTPSGTGTF